MAMSPRLLRPIASGVHPEAADWRARVIANGGTVSGSTLQAVSRLCASISSAGIRSRFFRLGIFAGDNLNAALVPLYRGPTFGGTTYGNTTDTNNGPFVSGDYAENNGLASGLSQAKYLDTGLATSALPQSVCEAMHLSAWHGSIAAINTDPFLIGSQDASNRYQLQTSIRTASAAAESTRLGRTSAVFASTTVQGARPATSLIGSRTSSTSMVLYRNGLSDATFTTSTTSIAGAAFSFFVFRNNASGTPAGDMPGLAIRSYSIGAGLDGGQAAALHSSLAALHAALGRT